MFAPWTHTNPAEFVRTFTTGHVVTSTILLNGRVTSGTFFGIGGDPICCFGVVFAFLEPFLNKWAETGLVVGEGTSETEAVAAAATDGGDNMVELGGGDVTFDSVFAVWRRTPFQVVIIIDIRAIQ
jgi:hypothetical protein